MPQTGSAGKLSFHMVNTAENLGIRTGSITQMIEMYLEWAEGYASYWIQMPNGVLLLQMIPEAGPASGAIYLLDLGSRIFYLLRFEELEYELTRSDFTRIVKEYGLLRYASNPSLIHAKIAQGADA